MSKIPDGFENLDMQSWANIDTKDQPRQTNRILLLLRGRLHWAILLAASLGIAGGLAGFYRKGNLYESKAQIRIPQTKDVLLYNNVESPFQINTFDSYMESQVQLIKSPQVLGEAILDPRWEQAFGKLPRQQALRMITEDFLVTHPRKTEVINFSFNSDEQEKAQAGVQSILDAYLAYNRRQQEQRGSNKIGQLIQLRQNELSTINRLQQEKGFLISEFGTETTILVEHETLRNKIQELKEELRDVQQKLTSLSETEPVSNDDSNEFSASDAVMAQLALTDPKIRTLLDYKELLEARLHMYETRGIGLGHKEVQNTQAELQAAKRQIEQYLLSASGLAYGDDGKIASPLDQLRDKEMQLQEEISTDEGIALGLAERINKIQRINEDIQESKDDLNLQTSRLEQLQTEESAEFIIQVLNSGDLPLSPSNKGKRVQFAILGTGFGGGMGVGIVLLLSMLDRRLRHADDAQMGYLDVRMLGVLPTLPSELTDPSQASIAAHAVHHVRTLLQIATPPRTTKDDGIVYAITGPSAGSGKTSMTISLGLSFAAANAKTLLIDCDLVAGSLTRVFEAKVHMPISEMLYNENVISDAQLHETQLAVRNSNITEKKFLLDNNYATFEQINDFENRQASTSIGLLDVCAGTQLREVICETDYHNLSILPIGDAQPHQAGALSPDAIRKLVTQARKYYDVILVDTGPILGSLEASIMASTADQVIMVVSRGDQKNVAQKSFEHLFSIKANIAGVVFNHALHEDMQKTSYATHSMTQSRTQENYKPLCVFDPQQTERYGPLATAVASYGASKRKKPA